MRPILVATLAGALLARLGLALAGAARSTPVAAAQILLDATVTRVVTGDTLDAQVSNQRTLVRYLGAETPPPTQPCGPQALARNQELLQLAGLRVLLEGDPRYPTDPAGARLIYAYTPGGQSIDATLIREGLARAVRTDAAHGAELAALEAEARTAGRGCLWDTTPPSLSVPVAMTTDAIGPSGAPVTYAASATDAGDPAPVVTCQPPSGNTFPIGTTPVLCVATDAAGNRATASFGVTVRGSVEQLSALLTLTQSFNANRGLINSLRDALTALTGADTTTACKRLDTFVSGVKAQAGKTLTDAEAAQVVAAATRIQAVVGCSP